MFKRATREDIDLLSTAGVKVLNDLPNYSSMVCDPKHTRWMLEQFIDLPQLGIFFKEVNGEVVALYMGIVAPPWFSPSLELSEIMLWVREDFRGTSLATKLIALSEEWGKSMGAQRCVLAAASGYKPQAVERFYNKKGYRTTGIQCTKEF